jgi:hypothetical protein
MRRLLHNSSSVFTMGYTHFSQLQRGSNVTRPIVASLGFTSLTLPFSKVRVSSGDSRLFYIFVIWFEYISERNSNQAELRAIGPISDRDSIKSIGVLLQICGHY